LADVSAIHLHPTAPLAERVVLPGDPGRALALAQALLEAPLMFNHHRGLWGYTGTAGDGEPLTIQATGMGGPSAAIVLAELIALGVRRAIRVGTCGALAPDLELGGLVGAGERASADPRLTDALMRHAPSASLGTVVSVDLFYERSGRAHPQGAVAIEMEAATLFALGAAERAQVGCVLTVSDVFDADGARTRIDDDTMLESAEAMGRAAIAALSE
jgi:uridine phosphorylase